jgi:hypothetical protein
MRNSIMVAGVIAVIIATSVGISQSQQEPSRPPDKAVSQIAERMDRMEQSQKLILQKLDTVLANQQKILSELDVVKVRATRR